MMSWTRDFIDLPWRFAGRDRSGVDCWGLLWLVYRDVAGVEVASYAQETIDGHERVQISELLAGDRMKWPWVSIDPSDAREFDMVVFKRGGIDSHIGIVTAPGQMLHILHGGESCVERFDRGRWQNKLVGVHRHHNLWGWTYRAA